MTLCTGIRTGCLLKRSRRCISKTTSRPSSQQRTENEKCNIPLWSLLEKGHCYPLSIHQEQRVFTYPLLPHLLRFEHPSLQSNINCSPKSETARAQATAQPNSRVIVWVLACLLGRKCRCQHLDPMGTASGWLRGLPGGFGRLKSPRAVKL